MPEVSVTAKRDQALQHVSDYVKRKYPHMVDQGDIWTPMNAYVDIVMTTQDDAVKLRALDSLTPYLYPKLKSVEITGSVDHAHEHVIRDSFAAKLDDVLDGPVIDAKSEAVDWEDDAQPVAEDGDGAMTDRSQL